MLTKLLFASFTSIYQTTTLFTYELISSLTNATWSFSESQEIHGAPHCFTLSLVNYIKGQMILHWWVDSLRLELHHLSSVKGPLR